MNLELSHLFIAGICYLLLLFFIAYAVEHKLIPEKIVHHPIVYTLTLGVMASGWAFYGIVDLAINYGLNFLSYYIGTALLFLLAPLLLIPLLRICRRYQLTSLADVLTFRFRSPWAGSIVTVFMLLAILPLLALQIQAVSDSAYILTELSREQPLSEQPNYDNLALVTCLIIAAFTILFGTRHIDSEGRHNGLVAAIAFETIVKIVILSLLGLLSVYQVFGGFGALEEWLLSHPEMLSDLYDTTGSRSTQTLLLVFFSAAVGMPHIFHMTFAENPSIRSMQFASWGVPLLLLLLSLPILPILWAGLATNAPLPVEYYTLSSSLRLDSEVLGIITFIGGLSAVSGVIVVSTLALASMCLNHLVLPILPLNPKLDIYRQLLWIKRILIIAIILAGYVFFVFIGQREDLSSLGLAAFTATLQLLPGTLAVLYFPVANRNGFVAGLIVGFSILVLFLLTPVISNLEFNYISDFYTLDLFDKTNFWGSAAIGALSGNILTFALVSWLSDTSDEEKLTAEVCSLGNLSRPSRQQLNVRSPADFIDRLSTILGKSTAQQEVRRALADLQLSDHESRPYALRRLRDRVEANLSRLMGPAIAHETIASVVTYVDQNSVIDHSKTEDIYYIENRLEAYQSHLHGVAAELDELRRYHRQILQELPMGACSIGHDNEILMWNNAIADLTYIAANDVVGSHLVTLAEPWMSLLQEFSSSPEAHRHKQALEIKNKKCWVSLHKATIFSSSKNLQDGQVILIEDLTETQVLEDELIHSERLASIGRLSAGVAHEIGNPITGIACLAQNLLYEIDDESNRDDAIISVNEILNQTSRIKRILQSLVNFSHSGNSSADIASEPIDIYHCVSEAIHLLQLNKYAREVNFINHCQQQHIVTGNGQRLMQVFINLLSNARDASPKQGNIRIFSTQLENSISISVSDEGSGIKPEHLEKIFEPFFTTKEAGEGTGLGLALVYSIVEEHNGSVDIESPVSHNPDYGTKVSILLPKHII